MHSINNFSWALVARGRVTRLFSCKKGNTFKYRYFWRLFFFNLNQKKNREIKIWLRNIQLHKPQNHIKRHYTTPCSFYDIYFCCCSFVSLVHRLWHPSSSQINSQRHFNKKQPRIQSFYWKALVLRQV